MADDIFATLSPNDLAGFSQSVQASDPYGMAGRSLGQSQFDMSTWSAPTQGIASFGKAFLSGLLQNQARSNAANQLSSVVNVLPQLGANPYMTAAPEGVDSGAFAALRGSAILNKAQSEATGKEKNRTLTSQLLQNVLGESVKNKSMSPLEAIKIATSDDPAMALEAVSAARPNRELVKTNASEISNNMPNLSSGRKTTEQRLKDLTNAFIEEGNMSPSQAAITARQQIEGEIKANTKSFDEAKAARDYGQNLLNLANTAQAGMSQAGETGPLNPLAKGYEYAASLFGSSEASQQIAGDTLLNSVAPDVIKLARPVGGGATSDFESKAYLGSGPSTSNTPEGNAILTRKMQELGQLNVDYADFLETYRDQNSGSTAGAGKKWNEYKQAYPLFIGTGENMRLNTERPSWQEYFSGSRPVSGEIAKPQPTSPKYEVRTAPNGQRYKVLIGQ